LFALEEHFFARAVLLGPGSNGAVGFVWHGRASFERWMRDESRKIAPKTAHKTNVFFNNFLNRNILNPAIRAPSNGPPFFHTVFFNQNLFP
jgi:hypothetical protein